MSTTQHIKLLYCCVRQVCHLEMIVSIFPRLQPALKVHRYNDIQATQTATTKELCSIPGSVFQDCFTDLQKRWKRLVDAEGKLFRRRSLAQSVSTPHSSFIPPVSELAAHKLYFHHPACPEIPTLRTPQRGSLMNIARKRPAIKFRPTHDFCGKSDGS